jgi:hypothetical protein
VKIITLDRKTYFGDLKICYEKIIKLKIYERKYNYEIKKDIQSVRLYKVKVDKKKRESSFLDIMVSLE